MAWVAQIGLFVLLGLLVAPITNFAGTLIPALVIGGALTLVARPLSVIIAATPFRVPWREQAFLSLAGLRGAVPIVVAIFPAATDVPGSRRLLDVVFVLVVAFTLAQSSVLEWVAGRLGVTSRGDPQDLTLESAPLDRVGAELIQLKIPDGSRLHGVEIAELRLPPGALVALMVRDERSVVPTTTTALRAGDELLVVVPRHGRRLVERRLKAVSEGGRLAGWLGSPSGVSSGGWWRSALASRLPRRRAP
jgi:cell volume regulation protein A